MAYHTTIIHGKIGQNTKLNNIFKWTFNISVSQLFTNSCRTQEIFEDTKGVTKSRQIEDTKGVTGGYQRSNQKIPKEEPEAGN